MRNGPVTKACLIHVRHCGPFVRFRIVFLNTLEYCVTPIVVGSAYGIKVPAEGDNAYKDVLVI